MRGKKKSRGASGIVKRAAADHTKGTGRRGAATEVAEESPVSLRRGAGGSTRRILEEIGSLPRTYEETRVVLTVIDPHLVNVRWDLDPQEAERFMRRSPRGRRPSLPVLRFLETEPRLAEARQPRSYFDVEVDLRAGNWYVPLWGGGKKYVVEMGFKSAGGAFYPLARSNTAELPAEVPSERADERLLVVIADKERLETFELPPPPAVPTPGREGLSGSAGPGPREPAGFHPGMPPSAESYPPVVLRRQGPILIWWGFPEGRHLIHLPEMMRTPEGEEAVDLSERAEEAFRPGVSS